MKQFVMEIANCDAGTLYLLNKDKLYFTIMHNKTMEIYLGGDGKIPKIFISKICVPNYQITSI